MKLNSKSSKKNKNFGVKIGWKDLILYGFLFAFLVFITLSFSDLTREREKEDISILTHPLFI